MTPRPRGGGLRAIERIAENRILQAMHEGLFDDLPGAGRPIPDIDHPYDPSWWIRAWLRREAKRRAAESSGLGGGESS